MRSIKQLKNILFNRNTTLSKIESFIREKADLSDYTAMKEMLEHELKHLNPKVTGYGLTMEKLSFINKIASEVNLNRAVLK